MIRRRPVALMYHGFDDGSRTSDPYDLFVHEQQLVAQLSWLRDSGWTSLDLDGYLARLDAGRCGREFLTTIDDGFVSVASVGAPVLHRHGVPSLLFVPPALAGGTTAYLESSPDEPLLDADGLRSVLDLGVELGVHGLDHTSMVGLSDAELLRHTSAARELLGDITGRAPRSFAYPFGDYDDRAVRAVARAGYDVAFSVYTDAGRHAISRVDVKPGDTLLALRVKLLPGYRRIWRAAGAVKPLRRALRTVAWRR